MSSIKDVAKAAGVSTATVSRVLGNKPHVTNALRQRVLEAVEELNYRPNLVARSLRSQKSSTIGLIVSDIRNPFFTSISRAVEDTAHDSGYSVFLCNTDEDPEKEEIYLKLMHDENVAGVIFSPTRHTAAIFNTLNLAFPTVVIDRTVNGTDVDVVIINNEDAAFRLTNHLIAQKYRHIVGVFGEMSTTGQQRRQGMEAALAEHGLVAAKIAYTQARTEAGQQVVGALLDDTPSVDAILTSNSLLTAGALKAIRQRGLRIPDDVALVGFDETTWSEMVEPPITLIAQPTYEIGHTATELLIQRIASPKRPTRRITLKGKLKIRGSSLRPS